ncbi:hypothetical protein L2E82_27155 [Cichorium intybus]|uniref:Uncharacterized protein n=1 Tax=Cichorium intybus TaxID=13427 RepID=A0ACB9CSB2_CICIN|nr:hypothetical protein L2E82_27155 [Cichorium intybus]
MYDHCYLYLEIRDRKEDFKDAVNRGALSLGFNEAKRAALMASFIMYKPCERSNFTKAALKTLESIGTLEQFLIKHRKDYVDPHRLILELAMIHGYQIHISKKAAASLPKQPLPRPKNLESQIHLAVIDLIEKMLTFDPRQRITHENIVWLSCYKKKVKEIITDEAAIQTQGKHRLAKLSGGIAVLKVFLFQKAALYKCNIAGNPAVVTRLVDSMTDNLRATRSEATDVGNAVLDGNFFFPVPLYAGIGIQFHSILGLASNCIPLRHWLQMS